jgi:diguanylate cyclase (GGDEF)-like protein/PAS domain S-box-containing protein
MNRAERNASIQGSDFNLFQTAVTLEDQVRQRTVELEEARLETEKITRALRERESNYRLLLENSPVSIHEIDMDGRIISMSRAGILMHGLKEGDNLQGSLYLDGVSAADRERIGDLLAKAYAGKISHFEFKASGPNEPIFKSCFIPIKNKKGNVEKLMGITEDITESKLAEEQIKHLATHDLLTDLPSLRLAKDRLAMAINLARRYKKSAAVMFIDLDGFKAVNDTLGHDAGDYVLQQVAQRMLSCVRKTDTVARIGGDEFLIIATEINAPENVALIAEKVIKQVSQPIIFNGQQAVVGASIGIALFPDHDKNMDQLIKQADEAMYRVKKAGRNGFCFVNTTVN